MSFLHTIKFIYYFLFLHFPLYKIHFANSKLLVVLYVGSSLLAGCVVRSVAMFLCFLCLMVFIFCLKFKSFFFKITKLYVLIYVFLHVHCLTISFSCLSVAHQLPISCPSVAPRLPVNSPSLARQFPSLACQLPYQLHQLPVDCPFSVFARQLPA